MNWPALIIGLGITVVVVVGGYFIVGRFVASSDERELRRLYTKMASDKVKACLAAQAAFIAENSKGIAAEAEAKYPVPGAPAFLYAPAAV